MKIMLLKKTALAVVLLSAVIVSQYISDRIFPVYEFIPPFVPPAVVTRILSLGLDSAAASYMWLSAIQDLSPQVKTQFGSLNAYISAINTLDPKFSYPYAFGTLVLPEFGAVDEGIKVGEAGMRALPDDWRIPYHLGIIYHLHKKDRASAARLFASVGAMEDTPMSIKIFAKNYGLSRNIRDQSRSIWQSILDESDDEVVRARAEAYLAHYDFVDFLETAAVRYKARYGKFPTDDQELVKGGILRELPQNPFGLRFVFDYSGQAISSVSY